MTWISIDHMTCQDEGIEPEPYEAPQTDDEAARDQQLLDDIFDTC